VAPTRLPDWYFSQLWPKRARRKSAVRRPARGGRWIGTGLDYRRHEIGIFYKGTGVPERRYGSTAPCIQQQASVPCVGSQERIMQLSDGRYLIYNMVNGLSLRNLMTIKSGPPAQITFSPITTVVADLPIADRQALLYSLADQRLWGFVAKPLGHSPKYESVEMGVPTNRGLATASLMMLKHLDNPGVIRTPAETQLAKLFELPPFFAPGSHSMARSGPDAVVVKDRRVPPTLLAHYDMRTGDLRQGIEVTGLPPATSCAEDTAREYVFNDNRDTVYLMREWSGEVFVLDSSFTAKRLASLPQADVNGGTGCKRGSNDGFRVPLAARTPSGHLVMATPAGVYIQRGESFDRLAAPDAVVQLLVLNDTEALVVAKSGLAKLSWPR
jgi:hypothetical protein